MKHILLFVFIFCNLSLAFAQSNAIEIVKNEKGFTLKVDGKPTMINGMNWDYFPIGTNYNFSLWNESDQFIKAALDDEMSLLKNMGVNAIRVYTGIPAKWITYIYNEHGIYTMLNHSFGRYGVNINNSWMANTDYANQKVETVLINEVKQMAAEYANTPGLLLYLIGNENNYGLFWDGAETEDIPVQDRKSTIRARAMYQLFDKAAIAMKENDKKHPIAICNGDLLFLEIIVEECKNIDIYGTNMYRGKSFGDAFEKVKTMYNKPFLLTEFGSDAFNAVTNEEAQKAQAAILKDNWKEIYQNAAGLGKAGNSIGGFTFQFSDGWWKFGQTKNLEVHDQNASWSNGGYLFDYIAGENNMNEEWFGICAKGPTKADGRYSLYPRTAYFTLKKVHQLYPYQTNITSDYISEYFNQIDLTEENFKAISEKTALESERNKKIKFSRLTAEFTTFNTGGNLITTPTAAPLNPTTFPDKLGFDHMQSFFAGIEANPTANMRANVELNILGNVAQNPIDQIFYENRGRPVLVNTPNGVTRLESINRVQVYKASYQWNHKYFDLNGFYRTGHYHWGYEGDFFAIYNEANYGNIIDIYNGIAPLGFEMEGKKQFSGLKMAFGPQLWWGANPAILLKYSKKVAGINFTGVMHEDLQQQGPTESSFAIPQPKTRRIALHAQKKLNRLTIDGGAIHAGQPLVNRNFQLQREEEGVLNTYQDKIKMSDTWGGKLKLTYTSSTFNWYAQSAAMGLVANGGGDNVRTFTGWKLKDCGSGNQVNFLTGFTVPVGFLQIAPNFIWQRPIEGPITPTGTNTAARPRNILDDPFVVRSNREMTAGEILFTYDPTPGTWMYEWDNDKSEDAKFAISAGFIYRHLPTTQDAAIGILPDGRTLFAFPGAAPARDLKEVHARLVSKLSKRFGFIANIYAGDAQANGSDARTINRYGMDVKVITGSIKTMAFVKVNDWGPYDYHRDFNLIFPLQCMLDVSAHLAKPQWFELPDTRIGIRGTWRALDQYSPRFAPINSINPAGQFVPDPTAIGFPNGNEWEIRVYLLFNIFN
jgi:hypothetical protein